MKTCNVCNMEKSESEFYTYKTTKKDGTPHLHARCKDCHKQANITRREGSGRSSYLLYQKTYHAKHRKETRLERLKWIDKIKAKPCEDCNGTFPPECMDFDHIDPQTKLFTVSNGLMSLKPLDDIKSEIKKCRLICANCHRIRTAKQNARGR